MLEWFAREADLSLVLDAPPPGTFNYSDTREYTPSEAIDLLNGVLQTKGYTLIRRGRMLLVVNLKGGLPEGVVPQVTLEELDRRGKFEMVTVRFPTGGRLVSTVVKEITPLLGPYGKVVPLPASAQVQVTDVAGIMRSVKAQIQSIAESTTTATGTSEVLAHYAVKPADPQAALATFKVLFPLIKMAYDETGDKLHVVGTPAEQVLVQKLIADMQTGNPAEKQSRLELYTVSEGLAPQVLGVLKTILPKAILTLDPKTSRIAAWGLAADHETIKQTITRIQAVPAGANAQELSFHVFKQPPPADLLTVLRATLPLATMKLDTDGKRLTIVATPDDRAFLESLLARYEKIAPAEDKNQLTIYPVTPEQKTRFQAVMTTLATDLPGIKVVADAEPNQLAVWAKPDQQEILHSILEQLRKELPPEQKSQLVVYPLTSADPASALLVLTPMFADAKFVPDKKTRKIAVWARPADQTAIKAALAQLDAGAPAAGTERMQSYLSPTADPTVAIAVLEELLPHVRFQSDPRSNAIFARAVPRDHDLIRQTLDEMRVENAPDTKPRLEVYPLDVENSTPLITMLQSLLPTAKFAVDADAHSVAVWGTKKDHDTIREAMGKLGAGGAGGPLETARQVEVYPLTKADPTSTLALLKTLIPKARLAIDARTQRLIVVATLADHNVVRGTLEQLQPETSGPTDPELQFYKLKKPAPATLVTGLQALVPAAQVTLDPTSRRLMVIAPPAEQELIKKNVERFEQAAGAEGSERLIVYPLKTADPTTVVTTLAKMFPHAEWAPDKKARRIAVLARPEDQKAIGEAIEQLNTGQAGDNTRESLMVYPVHADPKTVADMLQEIFPDMQFTPDPKTQGVIARGTTLQQHTVAGIVQRMEQSDEGLRPTFATYPSGKVDPTTLRTLLTQLVPNATVTADLKNRAVLALATPKEHEAIRAAVEKLAQAESPETAPVTASYILRATGAAAASRLLTAALPEAQFSVGGDPSQLIAYARPSEQLIIKSAVEQMESEGQLDEKRVMAVYSLPMKDAASLTLALDPTTLKNAKITPLPNRDGLLVWAEPAQQKVIQKSVEQFKKELPKALEETTKVYHFRWASPSTALTTLTAVLPNAKLAADVTARTLVASASPDDHKKIAAAVEEIDKEDPATSAKLVTYPSGKVDPTTLRTLLTQLVPNATVSADLRNRLVLALATPKEHEAISAAVDKLAQAESPETAPVTASYILRATGAAAASKLLTAALPEAQFAVGTDPEPVDRLRPAQRTTHHQGGGGPDGNGRPAGREAGHGGLFVADEGRRVADTGAGSDDAEERQDHALAEPRWAVGLGRAGPAEGHPEIGRAVQEGTAQGAGRDDEGLPLSLGKSQHGADDADGGVAQCQACGGRHRSNVGRQRFAG